MFRGVAERTLKQFAETWFDMTKMGLPGAGERIGPVRSQNSPEGDTPPNVVGNERLDTPRQYGRPSEPFAPVLQTLRAPRVAYL